MLCGGLGTRLREEAEARPKPMVNIGSWPIMWHIMKIYTHYGYKDFILALGYKGQMIKEYFYQYELINDDVTIELGYPDKIHFHETIEKDDWRITLCNTGDNALKGARLKRVEKYINDDVFMMTYADSLADIDINSLLEFHHSHDKLATVTGVNIASRFGELSIKGNQVISFSEKPKTGSELINGGFFVFNRGIFDYLDPDDSCDLEIGPLETIAHEGQLMVYKHTGSWACMDTPRDKDYLNNLWFQGKAFWKIWQ
jgi:glucose-1-phosphate cytidylyltransferase